MKRVLLATFFTLILGTIYCQNPIQSLADKSSTWDWMVRLGLNALDQSNKTSDLVASKSALGFQAGADVIWSPGWKFKGGVQYQYHEIFEINESTNIITAKETNDRNFHRLKVTAGSLFDIIKVDYLTIGAGADAAYNFDLTRHDIVRTGFNNTFDLEYFSGLLHLYVNIKKLQIDFGLEGNVLDLTGSGLRPLQSKTYTLTLGYFF